jgi:hypothetical protein
MISIDDPLEAARERGRAVARRIAEEVLQHFHVTIPDGRLGRTVSQEELYPVIYRAFADAFNLWDREHPEEFEQGAR